MLNNDHHFNTIIDVTAISAFYMIGVFTSLFPHAFTYGEVEEPTRYNIKLKANLTAGERTICQELIQQIQLDSPEVTYTILARD